VTDFLQDLKLRLINLLRKQTAKPSKRIPLQNYHAKLHNLHRLPTKAVRGSTHGKKKGGKKHVQHRNHFSPMRKGNHQNLIGTFLANSNKKLIQNLRKIK
jgi:hypothetical protein